MSGFPRNWHEMSAADFTAIDQARTVAILPIAAVEQHGPHLPLGVDAMINQGVLDRTLAKLEEQLPVLVLPMVWVGKSDEHIDFKGTITQSAQTLIAGWREIGESVARAGVRKLIFLNSHGGQIQIMQIVARQLRIEQNMFVVAYSWFQGGLPVNCIEAEEVRFGIHAGDMETSMMLALHPELVRMDRAENFVPKTKENAEAFPNVTGLGAAGFGWKAQDLHPSGAIGNAQIASAEKGEAIVAHAASALANLLTEVVNFPLANLRPSP